MTFLSHLIILSIIISIFNKPNNFKKGDCNPYDDKYNIVPLVKFKNKDISFDYHNPELGICFYLNICCIIFTFISLFL